jgi:uncharacterized membrane protein YeaQ/YmgE (transglycosylase-associated protein family)
MPIPDALRRACMHESASQFDLDQSSENDFCLPIVNWQHCVFGGGPMGIISWIVLGLIAGFIGSKIVNRQGQGFWLDIVLGIVGAIVGGFVFDLFGATGVTGLNIYSMIVAVIGAIVVLLIYNAVMGRRSA